VDHAILTISGITEAGQIMRYRIDEVMIARVMAERAKNVTIVADHSKIFRPALMTICDISQITHLVTDREPPAQFTKIMADCGTNVVVAE
jgi:DeoR family glycerol-3-phosphate regulon repressor